MRVRVGSIYQFRPSFLDVAQRLTDLEPGETVRVINLPMAPRANTMGQCHVERVRVFSDMKTRKVVIHPLGFAGMVSTNSLITSMVNAEVRL